MGYWLSLILFSLQLLQALTQLKSDNYRLREENQSLIRVISRLSGVPYNPPNSTYVCRHGRVHSYNRQPSYGGGSSYNLSANNQLSSFANNFSDPNTFGNQNFGTNVNSFNNSQSFNNMTQFSNNQGFYNNQPFQSIATDNHTWSQQHIQQT